MQNRPDNLKNRLRAAYLRYGEQELISRFSANIQWVVNAPLGVQESPGASVNVKTSPFDNSVSLLLTNGSSAAHASICALLRGFACATRRARTLTLPGFVRAAGLDKPPLSRCGSQFESLESGKGGIARAR